MKTLKAPLSIRIFYWIINLNLIVLLFVALGTLANILFRVHFFWNDMAIFSSFGLPTEVNFLELGNLNIDNQTIKVELIKASGQIKILDSPYFISKYIAPFRILPILFIGYFLWIFRKFIKNVKEGQTFNIKNISLLKRLASGLAWFWLYTIISMQLTYQLIAKNINFENITITKDLNNYSVILWIALLLWVLAHIFIKGLELQQEKDLTI